MFKSNLGHHLLIVFLFKTTVPKTTAYNTTVPPTPFGKTISSNTTTPPSIQPNQYCLNLESEKYTLEWPATTKKTLSQPPCVNQAKELAYRECFDGEWGSEPECVYIQSYPPQCPDGFEDIDDICYKLTPKSIFPPSCPSRDTIHFNTTTLLTALEAQISEPVWLPVTRDGFEFLRWVEPNVYYKMEYVGNIQYTGNIKGKDCLVYDHNGKFSVVACNEEHLGVCAYWKLNLADNKLCGSETCRQSEYFSKTKCFCFTSENENPKAELVEPYQNSFYVSTYENCTFGLEKNTNGTYLWSTSKQEINYTYWSPETSFDKEHIYGALTPSGWTLTQDISSCSLILKELLEQEVTFKLTLDSAENLFILHVGNPWWLETTTAQIVCFTNADPQTLLYSDLSLKLKNNASWLQTYEFVPVGTYPGDYWCDGFKASSLELIQTDTLFYNPGCWEFVVLFQVKIPSSINPLSSEILEPVYRAISTDSDNICVNRICYTPRIMKIVDLDEEKGLVFVNIHYTSTTKVSNDIIATDKEHNFYNVKSALMTTFNQSNDVEMYSFSSSDFCVAELIDYGSDLTLNWPTTSATEKTAPLEFCFGFDGNLVTNICDGDFINGYHWNNDVVSCKILKKSSVSESLLPLYYKKVLSDTDIKEILQVDFRSVAALDVYLLVEIYGQLFGTNNFPLDTFRQVIAQTLTINRNILLESQLTAHSTDKFLSVIDVVMMRNQPSLKIDDSSFIFLITSDVCGVVVFSLEGIRTATTVIGNWTLETFVEEVNNLEVAIWLSPKLRNKMNNQTLGFSFFFDDALFIQNRFPPKNVNIVFGLHVQEDTVLPGPVSIIQKVNDDSSTAFCLFWTSDVGYNPGFWFESGQSYNVGAYRVCDFQRSAHFALDVRFHSANVTDELEDLLGNNSTDVERVSILANISEKYHEFRSHDVLLVGKILDMVKDKPDNDLNCLAKTVDNLHKIEKSVLALSQDKHKATDLILHNIDNIIRNHQTNDSEVLITTDNFIIVVSNVKDSDLSGLLLRESNQTLYAQVLRGDLNAADIETENFSSTILLSSDLKYQLEDDAKVIITVFFSDVLFNEKQSTQKGVSKIFGVILPQIRNYSGPISILHNISSTSYSMECAHWNYSTNIQGKSYWKKDSNANKSYISQCDFWHTTHFALLLLNNDQYMDYAPLYWLSIINSAVSLAGVFFIILTAILFEKWRSNIGNQILLNFSVSIALQIVTFYMAGTIVTQSSDTSCTIVGVLLHYSTISEFCWMLTIAFLQFKRFVKVFAFSLSHPLLKACIVGWILPLIPVILTFVLDDDNYVNVGYGLCYPTGYILYLVVWIPVGVISAINLVIFVYIACSIINTKVECSATDDTKYHWRLFVLLFFMLGLTWSFGFMSWFAFGVIFAYIFCGLATLQGFVIFLYFIVFNDNTRGLYVHSIKNLCSGKVL